MLLNLNLERSKNTSKTINSIEDAVRTSNHKVKIHNLLLIIDTEKYR